MTPLRHTKILEDSTSTSGLHKPHEVFTQYQRHSGLAAQQVLTLVATTQLSSKLRCRASLSRPPTISSLSPLPYVSVLASECGCVASAALMGSPMAHTMKRIRFRVGKEPTTGEPRAFSCMHVMSCEAELFPTCRITCGINEPLSSFQGLEEHVTDRLLIIPLVVVLPTPHSLLPGS